MIVCKLLWNRSPGSIKCVPDGSELPLEGCPLKLNLCIKCITCLMYWQRLWNDYLTVCCCTLLSWWCYNDVFLSFLFVASFVFYILFVFEFDEIAYENPLLAMKIVSIVNENKICKYKYLCILITVYQPNFLTSICSTWTDFAFAPNCCT